MRGGRRTGEVEAVWGDVVVATAPRPEGVIVGAALTSDPAAALSVRERDVVALVSEGFSDVNIAARLFISEATVGPRTCTAHISEARRALAGGVAPALARGERRVTRRARVIHTFGVAE